MSVTTTNDAAPEGTNAPTEAGAASEEAGGPATAGISPKIGEDDKTLG